MKRRAAIEFFGSEAAVGKALGITRQAVGKWIGVVPLPAAIAIQHITFGKVLVDLNEYVYLDKINQPDGLELVVRAKR